MITSDQFWERLQSRNLIPPDRLRSLREQISKKPAIAENPKHIARVLVSHKVLSLTQAKSLLSAQEPNLTPKLTPVAVSDDIRATAGRRTNQRPTVANRTLIARLLAAATLLVILVVLAVSRPQDTGDSDRQPTPSPRISTRVQPKETKPIAHYQVIDSKDALWARPQPSETIRFPKIPTGTQLILRVQLASLMGSDQGHKLVRSLLPNQERIVDDWAQDLGLQPDQVKVLTLFLLPQGGIYPKVITHAELSQPAAEVFSPRGDLDEHHRLKAAAHGIWFPPEHPDQFYYGLWESIKDLPFAESGRLRRELEQLARETHDTDLISILANPNFLRDEAQGMFLGPRKRLLQGLFEFWSDSAQAVSLGYQHTDVAFIEIRMIPRDELPPRVVAGRMQAFIKNLPNRTRNFLGNAQLDPYWQPLAVRFPAMLDYLASKTRILTENRQVVLAAIAPAEAPHNLLLATELALATPAQVAVDDTASVSLSLAELFNSQLSVRFAQKSLVEAAQDIAQQVNDEFSTLRPFRIELQGGDLETEGITRNQQIRDFEAENLPLSQVLTLLVQKANPDQSVVHPSEPGQKLIWHESERNPGQVEISTRAAAISKGVKLPSDFLSPP